MGEDFTKLQSGSVSSPGSPSFAAGNSGGAEPLPDFFDPNTWSTVEPIYRVYGDVHAELFAEVDYEDYIWAIQWLWSSKRSRGSKGIRYICRQKTERNGGGEGIRTNATLMLHVEIMKRTGILPPTPLHTLVDHRDGKELNCRRYNLRWATHSMNRRNYGGISGRDIIEG